MKTLKLALITLLIACGQSNGPINWDELKYTHQYQGFVFRSEVPLIACYLDYDVETSRIVLDKYGLIPYKIFPAAFRSVPVYIVKEHSWNHHDGEYNAFVGITLNATMSELTHELLHAWDMNHLGVGTGMHKDWSTNGYNAAASEFITLAKPANMNP